MMQQRADTVIEQRWTHRTADGKALPLRNVLARFKPAATQRILYLTHWDTRPTADEDPVLGNRSTPIPGANDGAAGVGLFVALADPLKKTPPNVGVDLLFVDGEDYGKSFDAPVRRRPPRLPVLRPAPAVARLPPDVRRALGHDRRQGPQHLPGSEVGDVGARGGDAGVGRRPRTSATRSTSSPRGGQDMIDDHVPLIEKGLRVIDVIDIDYGPPGRDGGASPSYHHTLQDTIDKISVKSLQIVGDVALSLVTDF